MSVGLRELRAHELHAALERVLGPRLAALLRTRGPGHCMRVCDLDLEVMVHLYQQLRAHVPGAQVYVLSDGRHPSIPADLTVTSTKLVELRNPLADNTLRPPLLVFIPSDLRAAAEDSFGIATFEAIGLGDAYDELRKLLLTEVPHHLRVPMAEMLRRLDATPWPLADAVAVVRYLLTVQRNDYDRDATGAALFELGLVPDFELFTDLARAPLAARAPDVPYDILLGTTTPSPQYGILGEMAGRKVALDLNETHTISLFGVQGGGKSYTLGTIAEMAALDIPYLNVLPRPLATIIFHYSSTQDYKPEFTSMVAPNNAAEQLHVLRERYGAAPQALRDFILLSPQDKLEARRAEYPDLDIRPLKFASAELQASHWRFLMGAVGSPSTYIRQLNHIMREQRHALSLLTIRQGINASRLPEHLKDLAQQRLDLAAAYIDDNARLGEVIRPGRLVVVDLRDEFIEKDEALGLFVVLLQLFADVRYAGESFNKLVVFDEAHKYIESPDLVASLIEVVREMRHKGTSIMVASQDPPSVPVSLIELSSQIMLHKFNSPAWLKHIQKANAALAALTPEKMANLAAGEAYVWSSKATDEAFSQGAVKMRCRPRVTRHGGGTKTAVAAE